MEDYVEFKTEAKLRAAKKLQKKGKDYQMEEKDVALFKAASSLKWVFINHTSLIRSVASSFSREHSPFFTQRRPKFCKFFKLVLSSLFLTARLYSEQA